MTPHIPAVRFIMLPLFAVTAFAAAALLFVIEPLAGKALLPLAGSSPSVWTSVMLFFQAALLVGYGIAHAISRIRTQPESKTILRPILVSLALLAFAVAMSRQANFPSLPPESNQSLWVLATLAMWVGPGFVGVAMLSPLLQQWFASTRHSKAANPYILSVASSIGSAVGLLAYPLVIERALQLHSQWTWWGNGVMALFVLVALCALVATQSKRGLETHESLASNQAPKSSNTTIPAASTQAEPIKPAIRPAPRALLAWLAFAFVPSSLMLGVTQHISTDIAPVPLLWIVPLLIYLLSFALAFAPIRQPTASWWARAPVVPVLALMLALLVQARTPIVVVLSLHLAVFVLACMMCHKTLSERRPDPAHLTLFYFVIATGGVLGGLFNAIIAPAIFGRVLEYPVALGLLLVLREFTIAPGLAHVPDEPPGVVATSTRFKMQAAFMVALGCFAACACVVLVIDRFASELKVSRLARSILVGGIPTLFLAMLAFAAQKYKPTIASRTVLAAGGTGLLLASQFLDSGAQILHQERTFFGVHRVVAINNGEQHELLHGTTSHGVQAAASSEHFEQMRRVPGAYYHPSGPIGLVMSMLHQRESPLHVGLVGLGTGALAAYARPHDSLTFFEIDPAVIRIAQTPEYFTFVDDALARGATITMITGDGRLTLAQQADRFDLLVVDAFSSDAIPTHLLTREAMGLYLSKLADDGVLAFHISNRSFNLAPVLARHAQDMGLAARQFEDIAVSPEQASEGKLESNWFVLSRHEQTLRRLNKQALWFSPDKVGSLWTDDRSDILSVFLAW